MYDPGTRRGRRNLARRENAAALQAVVQQQTIQMESYQGPLPPPDDLARYDEIVPGGAERLFTLLEKQANHRMGLEKHVITWDVRRANLGTVFALIFGLAVLIVSYILIANGHEGPGVLALLVEFVTYGGIFVYSTETRRRERNQKARR